MRVRARCAAAATFFLPFPSCAASRACTPRLFQTPLPRLPPTMTMHTPLDRAVDVTASPSGRPSYVRAARSDRRRRFPCLPAPRQRWQLCPCSDHVGVHQRWRWRDTRSGLTCGGLARGYWFFGLFFLTRCAVLCVRVEGQDTQTTQHSPMPVTALLHTARPSVGCVLSAACLVPLPSDIVASVPATGIPIVRDRLRDAVRKVGNQGAHL